MINRIVHMVRPTAKVLYLRGYRKIGAGLDFEYKRRPILIPPILYHGTTARYLQENSEDGIYCRMDSPSDPWIYATPSSYFPLLRAEEGKNLYQSTPKLLVINTRTSLDDIARERKNSSELILFNQLREGNYVEVDLHLVEGGCPDFECRLEMNRDFIEKAIREILGLKRTVSMESIHHQDPSLEDWYEMKGD